MSHHTFCLLLLLFCVPVFYLGYRIGRAIDRDARSVSGQL